MEKKTILEYFKMSTLVKQAVVSRRSKVVLWSELLKAQDYKLLKVESAKFAERVFWRRRGMTGMTGMSASANNAVCAIVLELQSCQSSV